MEEWLSFTTGRFFGFATSFSVHTADATAHDRSTIDKYLRELRRCALTRQIEGPTNPDPTHHLSSLGNVIVERGVEDGVELLREQDR